jgi:hypothetical protein
MRSPDRGVTSGIWLDALGVRWEDHCAVFLVAIEWTDAAQHALRRSVELLADALGEQCIFLMVENAGTFLVWAPNGKPTGVPLQRSEVSQPQQVQ